VAPILVIALALYLWFYHQPNKSRSFWWQPDRETYVMFGTVQQFHRGSIEVRARGKDFYKVGVPFKGQWLIWNNSFSERTFRIHIWIYDKKFQHWTEYTLKAQEYIITLAPMEDILIETIGYINPDIMVFERKAVKHDFKLIPHTRSITLNMVISNPDQPAPEFTRKAGKIKETQPVEREGVDPGLRVGEDHGF
jgi:hypothetical protein